PAASSASLTYRGSSQPRTAAALPIQKDAAADEAETDGSHYTALILVANGMSLKRDSAIRILDGEGGEIWSGSPQFAANVGKARAVQIAGDRPLVIKAARAGEGGSELVLGGEGLGLLREATSQNPFMDSNCVIIVN